MSVTVTSLKCPECSATLPLPKNRENIFCAYCGSSIIVQNDNEFIIRHIDEARIKEAEVYKEVETEKCHTALKIEHDRNETQKEIELKKLGLQEDKRRSFDRIIKTKSVFTIIFFTIGLLPGVFFDQYGYMAIWVLIPLVWGLGPNSYSEYLNPIKKACIPSEAREYNGKTYDQVRDAFQGSGFTNVECVAMHDLKLGLLKKPNQVVSVSINGKSIESYGRSCDVTLRVVISYHSF